MIYLKISFVVKNESCIYCKNPRLREDIIKGKILYCWDYFVNNSEREVITFTYKFIEYPKDFLEIKSRFPFRDVFPNYYQLFWPGEEIIYLDNNYKIIKYLKDNQYLAQNKKTQVLSSILIFPRDLKNVFDRNRSIYI